MLSESITRDKWEQQRAVLEGADELLSYADKGTGIAGYSVTRFTRLYLLKSGPARFAFIHDLEWVGGTLHMFTDPADLDALWDTKDPNRRVRLTAAHKAMETHHDG